MFAVFLNIISLPVFLAATAEEVEEASLAFDSDILDYLAPRESEPGAIHDDLVEKVELFV